MRLCIQWPRFGPYHLARLRATSTLLKAQGVEVVGIETASSDTTYRWHAESFAEGIQWECLFPGRVFDMLEPCKMREAMLAKLDQLNPDAVAINSYSFPDARASLEWCLLRRRTALLMMESRREDADRSRARETLKSVLVRSYSAFLAGGSPQRDYLLDMGVDPEGIFVPYDVVDNDYFRTAADRFRREPGHSTHLPGLGDPSPFFLASARFVGRKNLAFLLKAYAAYRQGKENPWRLLLLGDGPLRSHLEMQARGIDGMTFCGFQQIDTLPAYYAAAGAFVHPALVEQWGLVVNEAMASGLPVLVSHQTGAARDLVTDGYNGFRFDAHNVEELASRMTHIAGGSLDLVAMGRNSQERISLWSPQAFAHGMMNALHYGLERGRKRPFGGRLVLYALSKISRNLRDFHAIPE